MSHPPTPHPQSPNTNPPPTFRHYPPQPSASPCPSPHAPHAPKAPHASHAPQSTPSTPSTWLMAIQRSWGLLWRATSDSGIFEDQSAFRGTSDQPSSSRLETRRFGPREGPGWTRLGIYRVHLGVAQNETRGANRNLFGTHVSTFQGLGHFGVFRFFEFATATWIRRNYPPNKKSSTFFFWGAMHVAGNLEKLRYTDLARADKEMLFLTWVV